MLFNFYKKLGSSLHVEYGAGQDLGLGPVWSDIQTDRLIISSFFIKNSKDY